MSARTQCFRTCDYCLSASACERHGELVPMDAQLDVQGNAHDLAPASERLKLFEPAPTHLPGQTRLELDDDDA